MIKRKYMRIFKAADTLIAQARRSPQVQSYPGYTMSSPHHPGIHGPYLKSTSKIKRKKYEKNFRGRYSRNKLYRFTLHVSAKKNRWTGTC